MPDLSFLLRIKGAIDPSVNQSLSATDKQLNSLHNEMAGVNDELRKISLANRPLQKNSEEYKRNAARAGELRGQLRGLQSQEIDLKASQRALNTEQQAGARALGQLKTGLGLAGAGLAATTALFVTAKSAVGSYIDYVNTLADSQIRLGLSFEEAEARHKSLIRELGSSSGASAAQRTLADLQIGLNPESATFGRFNQALFQQASIAGIDTNALQEATSAQDVANIFAGVDNAAARDLLASFGPLGAAAQDLIDAQHGETEAIREAAKERIAARQAAGEADDALREFKTTLARSLVPVLQGLSNILTPIVSTFSKLPEGVQTIIATVGVLAGALGAVIVSLGLFRAGLNSAAGRAVGGGLGGFGKVGKIGAAVTAAAVIGTAVYAGVRGNGDSSEDNGNRTPATTVQGNQQISVTQNINQTITGETDTQRIAEAVEEANNRNFKSALSYYSQ